MAQFVHSPEDLTQDAAPAKPSFIGPLGVGVLLALAVGMLRSPATVLRVGKLAPATAICVVVHLMTFYVLARAAGVAVEVVSIFFGGALLRFRWGGTWFVVNWLPVGGFVKMKGMTGQPDAADGWRGLSRLSRAAFCLAGPWAVLALGLCVLGPAKFKADLLRVPGQLVEVLRRDGPGAGGILYFVEHAPFRDVLGAVAVLFGIVNLLPLPIVNGGQAIAELLDLDARSPWLQRIQIASLAVVLTFVLLVFYKAMAPAVR
jgi:membrane-associated protease RseP (regulator of RpoE activity)